MQKILGKRPKPRVAIIGEPSINIEEYKNLFPTVWICRSVSELYKHSHPNEIDLVIVFSGGGWIEKYLLGSDIISFNIDKDTLHFGVSSISFTKIVTQAQTEEYLIKEKIPLPIDRMINEDLQEINSLKGYSLIRMIIPNEAKLPSNTVENEKKKFEEYGLVQNTYTSEYFVISLKDKEKLLFWSTISSPKTYINWVKAILTVWAKEKPHLYSRYGNEISSEWKTQTELDLESEIIRLENEKEKSIKEYEIKLNSIKQVLTNVRLEENTGIRRLITAQNYELVDAVKDAFERIGFYVEDMDAKKKDIESKKEDLRIRKFKSDFSWEAIVEVKGYSRSTGKLQDLRSFGRYSLSFYKEKNKEPNKQIYVINGEINLLPSVRARPFESAKEDIEDFGVDGGLVISSLDLFKSLKLNKGKVKESIINSIGMWTLPEEEN